MKEQTVPEDLFDLVNAQEAHEEQVMSSANVNGFAVGRRITEGEDTGELGLTVLVTHKVPADELSEDDLIPDELGGFRTDVQEVGVIQAGGGAPLGTDLDDVDSGVPASSEVGALTLRQRIRPVEGGYSIGHYKITAGTYATACYDLTPFPSIPRRYYALSNNHVLANSNNANIGDPILQPGPYDGGGRNDVVARLSRWVPINFEGECNYVDAAVAEGEFHDLDREIYWIGYVKDLYTAPKVGDIVQKTGRTTNFTTGEVQNINATVNVNFGGGKVAKFCRQIITTAMSAGGDSGSLVTNREEGGVGLLFAGSSQVTILNNLAYVQALLRVRIHEH